MISKEKLHIMSEARGGKGIARLTAAVWFMGWKHRGSDTQAANDVPRSQQDKQSSAVLSPSCSPLRGLLPAAGAAPLVQTSPPAFRVQGRHCEIKVADSLFLLYCSWLPDGDLALTCVLLIKVFVILKDKSQALMLQSPEPQWVLHESVCGWPSNSIAASYAVTWEPCFLDRADAPKLRPSTTRECHQQAVFSGKEKL